MTSFIWINPVKIKDKLNQLTDAQAHASNQPAQTEMIMMFPPQRK